MQRRPECSSWWSVVPVMFALAGVAMVQGAGEGTERTLTVLGLPLIVLAIVVIAVLARDESETEVPDRP